MISNHNNFLCESKMWLAERCVSQCQRQKCFRGLTKTKNNNDNSNLLHLPVPRSSLPTNYPMVLSTHQHHHHISWLNDRTPKFVHCNRTMNFLRSAAPTVVCGTRGKFADWQSLRTCHNPLTHRNFVSSKNLLNRRSFDSLWSEQLEIPQHSSLWPRDFYYQNNDSKVLQENNSEQLEIPSRSANITWKFDNPAKESDIYQSSKNNQNFRVHHVPKIKLQANTTVQRPSTHIPCLGSQWDGDSNQPFMSLQENTTSVNKKLSLCSMPTSSDTYLTEDEIDSLVSKIAEEASCHNFIPVWMVNERSDDPAQNSVSSPKNNYNGEPNGKDNEEKDSTINNNIKHNRRKQAKPHCSAKKHDPKFQGVIIDIQILRENQKCKLKLQSSYSLKMHSSHLKSGNRRSCCSVDKVKQRLSKIYPDKCCVSCNAEKTSSWIECDEGKLLCNACNTRFMKLRVRCRRCWHIPKTFTEPLSKCGSCGATLCYVLIKGSIINCNLPQI